MTAVPPPKPRVLVLYYSFSGQTIGLLHRLADGLRFRGVEVVMERLRPLQPLRFPVGNVIATLRMMVATCFRPRVAIDELSAAVRGDYDLIVLAGPTWSYNPSGPVLALLDRDGKQLLAGRKVLPLISCRGYWRWHWQGLRSKLLACNAAIVNLMVFTHPQPEPWRTIGVFLKIAGKAPDRSPFMKRWYSRFGHGRDQQEEAWRFGLNIGSALKRGDDLSSLDFRTPAAMP
ncbi:MAG: hypothetical protein OEV91_08490 [Desulfobulbaceae bacterium]|nr:hypothetical protein [Desulfobulbaceae bacterium]